MAAMIIGEGAGNAEGRADEQCGERQHGDHQDDERHRADDVHDERDDAVDDRVGSQLPLAGQVHQDAERQREGDGEHERDRHHGERLAERLGDLAPAHIGQEVFHTINHVALL
ncbi:hypothetical protein [Leucobacter soli]|uniref:hypothetical protein n=1 Tax=Leucobacter soli TaxID=2812850 RepID=UPI0036076C6C